MSDIKDDDSDKPRRAATEYGYGKPPQKSQFKKGVSGNPGGRPKGVINIRDIMIEELTREVRYPVNGKMRSLPLVRVLFRNKVAKAVRGDNKSLDWVIKHALQPKTLTELMGNRPVFEFTKEEAARFTKENMTKGMVLPEDDVL
jgi:hypothetical protein